MTTWVELKGIILKGNKPDRKTNAMTSLYVRSKTNKKQNKNPKIIKKKRKKRNTTVDRLPTQGLGC